jgi:hypothetical protein
MKTIIHKVKAFFSKKQPTVIQPFQPAEVVAPVKPVVQPKEQPKKPTPKRKPGPKKEVPGTVAVKPKSPARKRSPRKKVDNHGR